MTMKRYKCGSFNMVEHCDGEYIVLADVVGLIEDRMSSYRSTEQRDDISAVTRDKLRTCHTQMRGLLIDLRATKGR
jgi:hypothetical protein